MTTRALSALVALFAFPHFAAASDARFDALRARAQRLDSLGPFLERYVGSCKDAFTKADCEGNVRRARRELNGRAYTASIAERTLEIVRAERTARGYRFVVTPFIDGGGLALTNGEPRRQDAAGHPLIEYVVLEGALPSGLDEMELDSAIRTGRIELEVVFRPEGTWKLRRKTEPGFYEGVKARFLGLRLIESRSGAEIASRVF